MSSGVTPVPSHQAVEKLSAEEDDIYAESYSHFGIHKSMLQVDRDCWEFIK